MESFGPWNVGNIRAVRHGCILGFVRGEYTTRTRCLSRAASHGYTPTHPMGIPLCAIVRTDPGLAMRATLPTPSCRGYICGYTPPLGGLLCGPLDYLGPDTSSAAHRPFATMVRAASVGGSRYILLTTVPRSFFIYICRPVRAVGTPPPPPPVSPGRTSMTPLREGPAHLVRPLVRPLVRALWDLSHLLLR